MSLFPQIDSYYYTDDDKAVHQMMEYYYASAIQINQSFWSEADIDSRFLAGDQTLWNDIYGNVPAFRRRQFNFNRIRRVVNMITGYQRQNRLQTTVIPVENADQETADQLSKVLMWANNKAGTYEILSEAFEGAVTTGMNLLGIWMDYREDPINGNPRIDNLSYNEYLIDPFFKKHDLSDCRFIWTRKWLSKTEIKSLLPGRESEIDDIIPRGWRDGKFQFQPEAYNYSMQDLINYDEFWYMDYRKRKLLVDGETGETMEWTSDDDNMNRFLKAYPQITTVEQIIPCAKLAIAVNGRTMYHGTNPMGIDKYPFACALGYYMPQIPYFPWRVQGVVRGLRDAQYLYNRRKVIELDILESQINSGVIFKENALIDPKDAFLNGQGRSLGVKATANIREDIMIVPPPQIPPSMIELSRILGEEISQISGVNEELLGSATDDKAGILSMLRQGAGLTTLQVLYDQLSQTQKQVGGIFLDLIQKNFGPGKVRRILGEEPSGQFFSKAFQQYDCVVEEAVLTSTQKQLALSTALSLRKEGVPVPDKFIMENVTIQKKTQIIEEMEQQAKAANEQAQKSQQIIDDEMYQRARLAEAQIFERAGLGMERFSRVAENESLSAQRKSQAALDEVKAAKELQDMDISQLQKLVDIIGALKAHQVAEEQGLEAQRQAQTTMQSIAQPQQKQAAPMQNQMNG